MRKWTGILAVAGVASLALTACTSQALKVKAPNKAAKLASQYPSAPDAHRSRRSWDPVKSPVALSYCYSKQLNMPEDLLALAQEDCRGGTVAYYGQDFHIRKCPLLQSYRMTFICVPGVAAESSR